MFGQLIFMSKCIEIFNIFRLEYRCVLHVLQCLTNFMIDFHHHYTSKYLLPTTFQLRMLYCGALAINPQLGRSTVPLVMLLWKKQVSKCTGKCFKIRSTIFFYKLFPSMIVFKKYRFNNQCVQHCRIKCNIFNLIVHTFLYYRSMAA